MIISILTVLLVVALHLFPRRIREKVIYRLKRFIAKLRAIAKGRDIARLYKSTIFIVSFCVVVLLR